MQYLAITVFILAFIGSVIADVSMSLHIMLLQFLCFYFIKALFLMKNNVVDENLRGIGAYG
jgi:hypothetical protein